MKIKQLEYLLKVVECGSITKAAQQLFLSQPSLTKSIIDLEREYNIKIFDRTPSGIQITAEGKEFIYYARNTVTAIGAMKRIFNTSQVPKKHVLSVACQQLDFVHTVLIDLYNAYHEGCQHFNIFESNRSDVVEAVLSGANDLGIIVRSNCDTKMFNSRLMEKNLELHVLDTSGVYVSMGPKSPLYEKESIAFADLEEQLNIVLDMENEVTQHLYLEKPDFHFNMQNIIFSNSILTCIKFLMETSAHLYTPKWVLRFFQDLPIRSVEIITKEYEKIPINELVFLKRKNEPLNGIEKQFFERLQALFTK